MNNQLREEATTQMANALNIDWDKAALILKQMDAEVNEPLSVGEINFLREENERLKKETIFALKQLKEREDELKTIKHSQEFQDKLIVSLIDLYLNKINKLSVALKMIAESEDLKDVSIALTALQEVGKL